MNILEIINKFPTQESCVKHIENIRFGDEPYCLYCGSFKVSRHKEKNRQNRWQCSSCKKSFSVTCQAKC